MLHELELTQLGLSRTADRHLHGQPKAQKGGEELRQSVRFGDTVHIYVVLALLTKSCISNPEENTYFKIFS